MYKYIFIGLILFGIIENVNAQDRKAFSTEVTNKMSFMKNGCDKRQIVFRDDSIYGIPFVKLISKKKIEKDSLRHLLVDNGFYDFNFEQFELNIKDLKELNEALLKKNNPQLLKMLADSTFNKITYSYIESSNGINVILLLSQNYIIIEDEKEGYFALGTGYIEEKITVSGFSKKKGITYCEEESYSNIIKNIKNQKNLMNLDENGRFKITVDVAAHTKKYVGIKDSTGKLFSLIKFY